MSASRESLKTPVAPLHCAKCRKHNPHEAEHCEKCHAPLWLICQNCKKRCPRTASRCIRCVEPLDTGMFAMVKRAVRRTVRKISR